MRNLMTPGIARLAAAILATAAATPVPAAPPAPPAQPSGGWTPEGWSDTASVPPPASARAVPSPAAPRADAPQRTGWADEATRPAADGGGWRQPVWDGGRGHAFRYHPGSRLPAVFADRRYVVADWEGYGLPAPGAERDWVRYYDDAVLVDRYGIVQAAVPAIGWDDAARHPRLAAAREAVRAPVAVAAPSYETFQTGDCPNGTPERPCVTRMPDGSTTVTVTTIPTTTTTTTRSTGAAAP